MNRIFTDIKSILTKAERNKFITLTFLNTILSIADISSIALVLAVLNIYSGNPAGWITSLLQQFNISQQSFLPIIFLILIFILKNLAGYFITKAQLRHVYDIASRLAGKNLLLYLEGSYEDHVNTDSSIWVRRIFFQTGEFAQFVVAGIQQLINEVILIIISIIALALYNMQLLAIVSIVLLPAIFILSYITKQKLKTVRQNIKAEYEISLQYLNEAITGFVESNIYHKNSFFNQRYAQSRFRLNRLLADMQLTQLIPNRFFEIFAVLGLFIILLAANFNGNKNNNDILLLGAFVAAAYKIIPGISKIVTITGQIRTYFFTAKELLNQKDNIQQSPSPINENIESIELRHIQFSYRENIVFKDFNFIIKNKSFVGISGNSGRGKTTLIDIILGFLSPASGTVLYNGNQIAAHEIKKFWPQIAYVKQATFLLHDSILNNITLYKNDINKAELQQILNVTALAGWTEQLPDGIHTIITENGKNISGGQRQRIAIARALFKNTPVIILDEPFNELDESAELNLLNYFKQLSLNGKTILLVTHNTNSFSFCDNIIYLDEKP